jgi:hypothetical protein
MNAGDLTQKKAADVVRNAQQLVSERANGDNVKPTVTLWMDLLGFRRHLDERNWDLKEDTVRMGFTRIAVFHEAALQSMDDRFEIVQLNDAVVVSRDLPAGEERHVLTEFLALIDTCFEVSVLAERAVGGCGIRGVVARGRAYNLRGSFGWTPKASATPFEPSFSCPRPVMMNTAFGRAYGVESSHELVKCSSLYVEKALLVDFLPTIMENWNVEQAVNIANFGEFFAVRVERD